MQVCGKNRFFRNFAQSDDRILVPIAIERQLGAARNLPRTLSGEQDEIKSVGNLVDAIFDGNAGQTGLLNKTRKIVKCAPSSASV